MCGIAGIAVFNNGPSPTWHQLKAMCDTLSHRGPDDQGIDILGNVALGMRRLAVIDVEGGIQPIFNEDRSIRTVFNGEIYNFQDLRWELSKRGHIFRTNSDTEVIVHAYEEYGSDFPAKLNGMFAFALHDRARGKLILARDHIGIKPLYYSFQNGVCFFSSEIKAMMAHGGITAGIDPLACYHYLTFLTTPAPQTMFKGIGKIPAGHYIEVEFKHNNRPYRITGHQWWDAIVPPPGDDRYNDENWVKGEIRRLLAESIEKRMMSDVPFGVFLSGGIDSSTNVALMDAVMDRPVKTFTVGFKDEPDYNELN